MLFSKLLSPPYETHHPIKPSPLPLCWFSYTHTHIYTPYGETDTVQMGNTKQKIIKVLGTFLCACPEATDITEAGSLLTEPSNLCLRYISRMKRNTQGKTLLLPP